MRTLFLLAALGVVPSVVAAQLRTEPSNKNKLAGRQATAVPALLDIELAPSRDQLTAGGPIGIIGTLTNRSKDSTVFLTQQSITLMQPPELGGTAELLSWPAYFPSEVQVDTGGKYLNPEKIILALRPGQSMTIGWVPSIRRDSISGTIAAFEPEWIRDDMRFLFFTPGNYQVAVQAKYWTDSTRPAFTYLTATQTVTLKVLAPQSVIIIGSILGGLIAYLVLQLGANPPPPANGGGPNSNAPASTQSATKRMFGIRPGPALLAMLWSAVVTILLSRLSETQLPIRITVTDFWGAIVIGLFAQYMGIKWLDSLLEQGRKRAASLKGAVVP